MVQLPGITWSDSQWSHSVTATDLGLRAQAVGALVSAARLA